MPKGAISIRMSEIDRSRMAALALQEGKTLTDFIMEKVYGTGGAPKTQAEIKAEISKTALSGIYRMMSIRDVRDKRFLLSLYKLGLEVGGLIGVNQNLHLHQHTEMMPPELEEKFLEKLSKLGNRVKGVLEDGTSISERAESEDQGPQDDEGIQGGGSSLGVEDGPVGEES